MNDKYIFFCITNENIFNTYFLKLTEKFYVNFIITNISREIQIDRLDKLTLLKLGARKDDLFFLEFFGKDSELAFILIFSYLNTKTKIISSNKKSSINHQIAYSDQSDFYSYHYEHICIDDSLDYPNANHFQSKFCILEKIANHVSNSNKTEIFNTLSQREMFSSTQLNQYIAIPHILCDTIKKPLVIVKSINSPIRWSYLDETVQLVIAIILPKEIVKQVFKKFTHFFIWLNNPENQNLIFKMRKDKKIIFLIDSILNQ